MIGKVKVIASINDSSAEAIRKAASDFLNHPVDICEWRIDCFEQSDSLPAVIAMLAELREMFGHFPILATFRTSEEGGASAINPFRYEQLLNAICESQLADAVDIELLKGDDMVRRIIKTAHAYNVKAVVSNHDFEMTPEYSEMLDRLNHMDRLGADIVKLAVMPHSISDVSNLLNVTAEYSAQKTVAPAITISMGALGQVSRIEGYKYGSFATFGCIGTPSAPGQITVEDMVEGDRSYVPVSPI